MTNIAANYYELMGLSPLATDDDVRRAYRILALRWHPDQNPQNRDAATHYTALLNQAYAHLRTAPQRRAYERAIALRPRAITTAPVTARSKAPQNKAPHKRQHKPPQGKIAKFFEITRAVFWPLAPVTQETQGV